MVLQLFHVSDNPDILRFDPRPVPTGSIITGDAVWAVDEPHLCNYLLPRDCPRVTFTASPSSSVSDVQQFLFNDKDRRVVAVEWDWLARIRSTTLFVYQLPVTSFEMIDSNAGYCISRKPVTPISIRPVTDLLDEMNDRRVEFRIVHNLWPLHNTIANSTLEFSMIRMRNAKEQVTAC